MPFDPNSPAPARPAGLPANAPNPVVGPPPNVVGPEEAGRMARAAGYTGGPPSGPAPTRPAGLPANAPSPTASAGMGMRAAGFNPQSGGGPFGTQTKQATSLGEYDSLGGGQTPYNRYGSRR